MKPGLFGLLGQGARAEYELRTLAESTHDLAACPSTGVELRRPELNASGFTWSTQHVFVHELNECPVAEGAVQGGELWRASERIGHLVKRRTRRHRSVPVASAGGIWEAKEVRLIEAKQRTVLDVVKRRSTGDLNVLGAIRYASLPTQLIHDQQA